MLKTPRPEEKVHPEYDAEASLAEARKRMSFEQVIEQHGHGPKGRGSWRSFECPFCEKKAKAGLFKAKGCPHLLFKCQSTSCPTGAKAMDEVGFIMQVSGLSRKDAFQAYLKQAGVWRERTTLKRAGKPEGKVISEPVISEPVVAGEEEPSLEEIEAAFSGDTSPRPSPGHLTPALSPSEADAEREEKGGTSPRPSPQSGEGEDEISVPAPVDASSPPVPSAGLGDDASQASDPPANVVPLPAPPPTTSTVGTSAGTTAGADGERKVISQTVVSEAVIGEGEDKASPVVQPVEVVRAFYAKLSWSPKDERTCWEKRGLSSRTCDALGFRSNPKNNRGILLDLALQFEEEVLLESGLWVRSNSDHKPKPSGKFWGWGRKARVVTFDDEGFPEKAVGDMEYEQNDPILIPYYNHKGDLISLRPHKDMGAKGTTTGRPHLYVPRAVAAMSVSGPPSPRPSPPGEGGEGSTESRPTGLKREFFRTVVVTEGEFKAAALWQILGMGRRDGRKPLGVCALPGISFARNYDLREELDVFLRMSCAEQVVVVFDNEDKGSPTLADGTPHPSFKPDWRKRHDAEIFARYLAEDLYSKLHLKGSRVGRIGDEWRDRKGKADWDGMMAEISKQ